MTRRSKGRRRLSKLNQLFRAWKAASMSERNLFASEDALARSDQTVSSHLVSLYKALGGGWEIEEMRH